MHNWTAIPAPGGPIKIMRIDSLLLLGLGAVVPSAECSLASNCSTRISSLETISRRESTTSSLIGAIGKSGDQKWA